MVGFARAKAFDAYVVLLNVLMAVPFHRFREWAFKVFARDALGRDSTLGRGVRLTTKGGVTVGAKTIINGNVTLDGRGRLAIGPLVNISPDVAILTADHDPQSPTFFEGRVRETAVGARAWISTRAIVLPGSTIGEGAIIAAGAVVHGSVEPWTIVAGNPARVIGTRSTDAQSEFGLASPYRRLFQ